MNNIFSFKIITPHNVRAGFAEQLDEVKQELRNWMVLEGVTPAALLSSKVFLTDAANQKDILFSHSLYTCYLSVGAVSCIEQPVLSGVKVALRLWFCNAPDLIKQGTPDCLIAHAGGKDFIFHTVRFTSQESFALNGEEQTKEAFRRHIALLEKQGMNLKDHCLRTWLYVRDIDRHYASVVEGRNKIFNEQGLVPSTHFIASTGIGGVFENKDAVVAIDFLSVNHISKEDVHFLKALDFLNPTHEYGVAFERGTRVQMLGTSLYFISGTASIDKYGQCVHRGDVLTQTGRLFLNIEKLLNDGGATLSDVRYMVVYLRDITDYVKVAEYMRVRFPMVPYLILEARVCRPEWLIEVECIATRV